VKGIIQREEPPMKFLSLLSIPEQPRERDNTIFFSLRVTVTR
jgi:hypothetical protein